MNSPRAHLAPSARAAMRLLDRAAAGEPVSEHLVTHALTVTGDIGRENDLRDTRDSRKNRRGVRR